MNATTFFYLLFLYNCFIFFHQYLSLFLHLLVLWINYSSIWFQINLAELVNKYNVPFLLFLLFFRNIRLTNAFLTTTGNLMSSQINIKTHSVNMKIFHYLFWSLWWLIQGIDNGFWAKTYWVSIDICRFGNW